MHKVKWQKLLKLTQLLSLLFNKKLKNLKASWKLIFFFKSIFSPVLRPRPEGPTWTLGFRRPCPGPFQVYFSSAVRNLWRSWGQPISEPFRPRIKVLRFQNPQFKNSIPTSWPVQAISLSLSQNATFVPGVCTLRCKRWPTGSCGDAGSGGRFACPNLGIYSNMLGGATRGRKRWGQAPKFEGGSRLLWRHVLSK